MQNKSYVFKVDSDEHKNTEGYTKPGWYFWDETETTLIGPFETSGRAIIALRVYCTNL